MTSLKINYSEQKELVLKDICKYIGADCWRVSVLNSKDNEVMVIYDSYLQDEENPTRDLLLEDFRFLQSILEGKFKIMCEFFGDHTGGIITFYLEEENIVYKPIQGSVYVGEDDNLTYFTNRSGHNDYSAHFPKYSDTLCGCIQHE